MRRAATIARNTQCWIGIGCVIEKNGKVLAEAWNETLTGESYCFEFRKHHALKGLALPSKARPFHNEGCVRHELGLSQGAEIEKVCSIHAEASAIAKAAKRGILVKGATMYATSFPCIICMRSIVAAGIKKVLYMNDFYKPHDMELFEENGVTVEQITEKEVWDGIKKSKFKRQKEKVQFKNKKFQRSES